MSRLAFALVAVVIAQPAFAQTSVAPPAASRLGALRPAQSNPYGKLFEARQLAPLRALASKTESPKRTVVCGLTIVEGDPQIDPKIAVTKTNEAVDYTIKKIDPPICKP
jgi:hypothetical protein